MRLCRTTVHVRRDMVVGTVGRSAGWGRCPKADATGERDRPRVIRNDASNLSLGRCFKQVGSLMKQDHSQASAEAPLGLQAHTPRKCDLQDQLVEFCWNVDLGTSTSQGHRRRS